MNPNLRQTCASHSGFEANKRLEICIRVPDRACEMRRNGGLRPTQGSCETPLSSFPPSFAISQSVHDETVSLLGVHSMRSSRNEFHDREIDKADTWRRFANSSCPVCTHHHSFFLYHLRCPHLRRIASFATYGAPKSESGPLPLRRSSELTNAGKIKSRILIA